MFKIGDTVSVRCGRNSGQQGKISAINETGALIDFGRTITLLQSDDTQVDFTDAYWVPYNFLSFFNP